MKYDLVNSTDLQVLIEVVNQKIQDGWKPQGGFAVGAFANGAEYYQAIVKD